MKLVPAGETSLGQAASFSTSPLEVPVLPTQEIKSTKTPFFRLALVSNMRLNFDQSFETLEDGRCRGIDP
jgi:hypothetical protein